MTTPNELNAIADALTKEERAELRTMIKQVPSVHLSARIALTRQNLVQYHQKLEWQVTDLGMAVGALLILREIKVSLTKETRRVAT